jgi:hypothetical protein
MPPTPMRTPVLSDYHFEERGAVRIWLHRDFAERDFIDRFAECDQLLARRDCRIVKDEKKITVGRLSLTIAGNRHDLYVKRFNAFSFRYRLGSLVASSGAMKSLRGAAVLQEAGICTARPVAAVENRFLGTVTKSFFVTEEIAGGKTADSYWLEDLASGLRCRQRRRKFIEGLASLFRSLHGAAIYHNDLKDANIVTVPDSEGTSQIFYLIDVEGVQARARRRQTRWIKNLVQINRTLGRYCGGSEKLYFLKQYLEAGAYDRKRVHGWIRRIVAESDRRDAVKGIGLGALFAPGEAPRGERRRTPEQEAKSWTTAGKKTKGKV